MAQLINITSEALQATVRRLLPSQQGFGEDLQATNVVTPIIDLTPTAEGSQLPVDLARAIGPGGITGFENRNASSVILNTPGFYLLQGTVLVENTGGTSQTGSIFVTSGGVNTNIIRAGSFADSTAVLPYAFTLFLDTGETVTAASNGTNVIVEGFTRQVADRYGNIVNPSGFTFE